MTLTQSTVDVAQWLLNTTQQALIDCARDPISRAYVAAGEIAWDDCCGMLVVAPERVYRSSSFPTEDPDKELCFEGYVAIQYVVLVVRCVPTVDARGNPPSQAALQAAYEGLLGDAAVVYNAITGPMPDYWLRATPSQSFVGANGGCIAVETRVVIGLEQDKFAICCTEPQPHIPGDPVCRLSASNVRFEPCEPLTSDNVQDALCELLGLIEEGVPGPPGPPGPQGEPGPPGPPGPIANTYYGSFYDMTDQVPGANVDYALRLDSTDLSNGVSVVANDRITFANAGVYDVQFSAQLHNRSGAGSGNTFWLWLAKNGIAVPNSATRMVVQNNTYHVAAWDFMVDASAGDYVQLIYRTDNANLVLEHDHATGSIPAVPSLIVTVLQVGS